MTSTHAPSNGAFRAAVRRAGKVPFAAAAVLLGLAALALATSLGGVSPPKDCEPYCAARTDRDVIPYPAHPPVPGKAGSRVIEPEFPNAVIYRVTAGSRGEGDFTTPGASIANPIGADSSEFIYYGPGSAVYWEKVKVAGSDVTLTPEGRLPVQFRSMSFDLTTPHVIYGIDNAARNEIESYNTETHQRRTIAEPEACPGIDIPSGPRQYGGDLSATPGGTRFSEVIWPEQDSGQIEYIWDAAKGCRWLNTHTGQAGGQWGPAGAVKTTWVPASMDRGFVPFLLHASELNPSGRWVLFGSQQLGTASGAFWQADTLNLTYIMRDPPKYDTYMAGHGALGFNRFYSWNGNTQWDLRMRAYGEWTRTEQVVNPVPERPTVMGWNDNHVTANIMPQAGEAEDSTPVCWGSVNSSHNPTTPGAPLLTLGPWQNEIDCASPVHPVVWRFAHTYGSGRNGFWSEVGGNVSPRGDLYLFTSDWEGTLGGTPPKARTDVFLLLLNPSPAPGANAAPSSEPAKPGAR